MTIGAAVWVLVGASWLAWSVVTRAVPTMPGIAAVLRAILGSWLGRLLSLAVWAEAGWHLFGQRP